MPIIGLTDIMAPGFVEVGRLRLGVPRSQFEKEGSGPKELPYFRADFRPDDQSQLLYARFVEAYGGAPTRVNFRLPFTEIHRSFDASWECYNKQGLLAQADGERFLYLRDNQTDRVLVRNGDPYMPFDPAKPVYSYKNKKGEDVPVFARRRAMLRMLIPELRVAAYVVLATQSYYNIRHFTEQLAGIAILGQNIGIPISMIPLVLSRRKELISVNMNGRKSMAEKYICNIEVHPIWMEAAFAKMDGMLPGGAPTSIALLPSNANEEEYREVDLDEQGFDDSGADEAEFYPAAEDEGPVPQDNMPVPVTTPQKIPVRMWKGAIVKAILDAQLADSAYSVTGALNKSKLTSESTVEEAMNWMKLYRGWRDFGLDSEEAAIKANTGEVPA